MGQVLQDRERLGHLDLEASEMAIRTAMHQMGGVLLEKLLNSDGGGYRGAHLDCSQGHAAEFVGYRDKEILTVVSSVEARRAYYHCQECQSGFAPKDKELDRSEEHTSELQSPDHLVCRLLLEKKKK